MTKEAVALVFLLFLVSTAVAWGAASISGVLTSINENLTEIADLLREMKDAQPSNSDAEDFSN